MRYPLPLHTTFYFFAFFYFLNKLQFGSYIGTNLISSRQPRKTKNSRFSLMLWHRGRHLERATFTSHLRQSFWDRMHNIYTANNKPEMFQPLTSDIENSNVYGLLVLETDVKVLIDIKIKFTFSFFFLT